MFNLIYFFRVSKNTWHVQMGLSYYHLMDAIKQQKLTSIESNAFKKIHSQVPVVQGQVQKGLVELSFLDKLSILGGQLPQNSHLVLCPR